jgi:GntR family transcriptional regulator
MDDWATPESAGVALRKSNRTRFGPVFGTCRFLRACIRVLIRMADVNFTFTLDGKSSVPIYTQLMDQVRRRIAAGTWVAGVEVPSVRAVAQALRVNPMTVSMAYNKLENEGLLVRRRGLPMVVAAHGGIRCAVQVPDALLGPTLARAAAEARQLGISDARSLALFKAALQASREPATKS